MICNVRFHLSFVAILSASNNLLYASNFLNIYKIVPNNIITINIIHILNVVDDIILKQRIFLLKSILTL